MSKIMIAAVAGATASGKTALAIELAKRCDGEIVSADSMQIYKYMDIGTAKPTARERAEAVHHLIDFVELSEPFSAADYAALAHERIADIAARGKLPIICGGTGLYVNSVIDDVKFAETERDGEYRAELFAIAEKEGNARLHDMLRAVDPKSADAIHENNVKRVVRALEFYSQTGTRLSEHKAAAEHDSRYAPIMFAPDWDRALLYERVNRRVDIMLESGLVGEVKALREMGLTRDMQSMQGIGYKEIFDYLDGGKTLSEAAEEIKLASRRYAKRQLTWFRRDKRIHWLAAGGDMARRAEEIVNNARSGNI
ncbi:MAG: tRNA (adenosine(37)-N6)-dimethylallyltransferase MiaA [Firmicutes bacterium]|nr:tRNA (adenosine(37)-N6)-dimethylallyltransferase MiaA [Bacillota bacterium]